MFVNIRKFDIQGMTIDDVYQLDFCDLEIAYKFYYWCAKIIGFSVCKDHIVRNKWGQMVQ